MPYGDITKKRINKQRKSSQKNYTVLSPKPRGDEKQAIIKDIDRLKRFNI